MDETNRDQNTEYRDHQTGDDVERMHVVSLKKFATEQLQRDTR